MIKSSLDITEFLFSPELGSLQRINSIWTGGKCPLRAFSKYLKNGLTDLRQTLTFMDVVKTTTIADRGFSKFETSLC